jgi:MFS family permease
LRVLSPSADAAATRDRLLVPVAGLCLLVSTAVYLMVFTMLTQIGTELNMSGATLGWIVIATIIVGTVSATLLPALSPVLGRRQLMVASMAFLAAGSAVSAAAPDSAMLLAGRILASLGFAASSLSIVIVREHRSGPQLSRAFGVMAAFSGAAAGIGFTVGGAVEQASRGDWRLVFVAMAVAAAVTAVLAAVAIPRGTRTSSPVDVPGAVLLTAGLVAALLPVTNGAAWGWTSWRVTGLLAAALVLLTAWVITELKRADPLVRLDVLRLNGVAGGLALFIVAAVTTSVVNLTVPPFLEAPATAGYGAAASVLGAGLDLLPLALAITASGFAVGRLARFMPAQLIAIMTLSCEAIALGLLTAFHQPGALVVILIALFGLGHGGTLAVEYVLLTRALQRAAAGGATGLATAVGGISGAVASAATTALLVSRLAHTGNHLLPAVTGYTHAWLCAAAVAAAGALGTAIGACAAGARTRPAATDAACEPGISPTRA